MKWIGYGRKRSCVIRSEDKVHRTTDGGNRGVTILVHNLSDRRGTGIQRHAPAALPPGKRPGTHFTGEYVHYRILAAPFQSSSPELSGPTE